MINDITKDELIDHDLHSVEKTILTIMEEQHLTWEEAEDYYWWTIESEQEFSLASEFGQEPEWLDIPNSSYDWLDVSIVVVWALHAILIGLAAVTAACVGIGGAG